MATYALRLRRALPLTSTFFNHQKSISFFIPVPSLSQCLSAPPQNPNPSVPFVQSRGFRSSATLLSSRSPRNFDSETINPDDILFEGCDYNHWLITMDFPKDPRPSDEEMVETYVQTAAAVLGSREEAMKKIYACSTTTYQGFQVQVTEEVSEKFRGLPGVVFILPDSYIDPVNKEYGGDKYDNGVITRRPPPVLHTRQGRYGDQNRDYNRSPRGPMQQGPPPQQNYQSAPRGPMQQGPPPQQNYQSAPRGPMQQGPPPQQNYQSTPRGPMQQGPPPHQNYQSIPRGPMQQAPPQQQNYPNSPGLNNVPVGQGNYQVDRRDPVPSYQGNYNQGERRDYPPPGQRDFSSQDQRNYAPPGQRDFRGDDRNYAPSPAGNPGKGWGGNPGQEVDGNFGQRSGENFRQGAPSNHWQGGSGTYEQGPGGAHGSTGYGENSSFAQVEQKNNVQGQHENQNRSW